MPDLDDTFSALADPTRRAMIERLSDGKSHPVGELAGPLAMTLPAVLKHVNVLSQAGLLVREKQGRTVYCRLQADPMRAAMAWLERYEKFWSERLDALQSFVEDTSCPPPPSRASRSNAISKPRSSGSSAPGRKGKP